MKREKTACHCHNVSYGKIIDAVQNGASTYVQVQEATVPRICGNTDSGYQPVS